MKIKQSVINEALSIAKKSNVFRGKVGAVLFKENGHIISKACNVTYLGSDKQYTIHAEANLIIKCSKMSIFSRLRKEKLNILVARWVKNKDSISIAKPCNHCGTMLRSLNIPTYYTNREGNIQRYI